MIDAEIYGSGLDVLLQKWCGRNEIKKDAPASHLRMVITPRMILPLIAVAIGYV